MKWRTYEPPPDPRWEWHSWFAWHPVTVGEETFWLTKVERRILSQKTCINDCVHTYWEYREKESE